MSLLFTYGINYVAQFRPRLHDIFYSVSEEQSDHFKHVKFKPKLAYASG